MEPCREPDKGSEPGAPTAPYLVTVDAKTLDQLKYEHAQLTQEADANAREVLRLRERLAAAERERDEAKPSAQVDEPCGICPGWMPTDGGTCVKYLIHVKSDERYPCDVRKSRKPSAPATEKGA